MRILKIQTLDSVKERKWYDKDTIMLHACFQLLVDYVEIEKGDMHCNYEEHKWFVDEVRFLYKWWKQRTDEHPQDNEMLLRLVRIRQLLWT